MVQGAAARLSVAFCRGRAEHPVREPAPEVDVHLRQRVGPLPMRRDPPDLALVLQPFLQAHDVDERVIFVRIPRSTGFPT